MGKNKKDNPHSALITHYSLPYTINLLFLGKSVLPKDLLFSQQSLPATFMHMFYDHNTGTVHIYRSLLLPPLSNQINPMGCFVDTIIQGLIINCF